jgi:hypothetical protein
MVNSTDAKDIALHYLGAKELELNKTNIVKNIAIAKTILALGYPVSSIIIAIDLYKAKMYSLGFIKFVIEETHNAIVAKTKEDLIREALTKLNSEHVIYSESGDNGNNRNREKLARKPNEFGVRKSYPDDLFKQ